MGSLCGSGCCGSHRLRVAWKEHALGYVEVERDRIALLSIERVVDPRLAGKHGHGLVGISRVLEEGHGILRGLWLTWWLLRGEKRGDSEEHA
jgi:hypothetical protein